jgi:hypothetical protein
MKWLGLIILPVVVVLFIWLRTIADASSAHTKGSEPDEPVSTHDTPLPIPPNVQARVVRSEEPVPSTVDAATRHASEHRLPTRDLSAEDVRDYLKTEFQRQKQDAPWAGAAAREIKDYIVRFVTNRSHLDAIECRASICELRISHENEDDYASFLDKAFARAAFKWGGEIFITRDSTRSPGKDFMVGYFSKEGTALPKLDPE